MDARILQAMLDEYAAFDEREEGFLKQTREFLQRHPDESAFNRKTAEGHITASSLILNEAMDKALLLRHALHERWFQPGGHVDMSDNDFITAVLREATEETGITGLRPYCGDIFDIDVHPIAARPDKNEPAHLHHDIRMLLIAPHENFSINAESISGAWCTPQEVTAKQPDLYRMIAKWRMLVN